MRRISKIDRNLNPEDIMIQIQEQNNFMKFVINTINQETTVGLQRNLVFQAVSALIDQDKKRLSKILWSMPIIDSAVYLIVKDKIHQRAKQLGA